MEETPATPKSRRSWTRGLLVFGAVLLALLLITAYFLPYLLKRYIEAHSVEWIDRKVTIDRIVLNPFTFTYGIDGLTCHEPKGSADVFVSWKKVSVKADLWSAWRNNVWRFREARLIQPYVRIIQAGDRFNFSDLLELGGSSDAKSPDTTHTVFSIEDIRIIDGSVDYRSNLLKEDQGLRALNASCTRITSESARMDFDLAFSLLKGGDLKGGFMIDTDRSLYAIDARLSSFALPQLLPYLQDIMHTTALKGAMDLDLHLRDSWAAKNGLAVRGRLGLSDVRITDQDGAELVGLKKADVLLDTLESRTDTYHLRRVSVEGLSTHYAMYANGTDTWSQVLKLATTAIASDSSVTLEASPSNVFVMLADYIRVLGQDFVANRYNADSVVFSNGTLRFEDHTPEMPFRYELSQLDVRTARSSSASSVDFTANALLNGQGRLQSTFRFDPKDFHNVDVTLSVDSLALADLDAYGRWYAAFPINSGLLAYNGHTSIQAGRINSVNHLVADKLKLGKKTDVHDPDIYVLPLRLAVSLLKDKNGVVELDVPVTGDLNDPQFKAWPIVWQVLKNLLTKAVAAPGRLLSRAFGGGDDDVAEEVRFDPLRNAIGREQQKALNVLVKGLKAKEDLVVALIPLVDSLQEMEELAAFRVKQQFLGDPLALSADDSTRIGAFSLRDTAMTRYLDLRSPGTAGKPERERCLAIIGHTMAQEAWRILEAGRSAAVLAYLQGQGLPASRVSLRRGTAGELRGAKGRPGYKFVYDAASE